MEKMGKFMSLRHEFFFFKQGRLIVKDYSICERNFEEKNVT